MVAAWKAMARYQCYVVYRGRRPGIYNTWTACKEQVYQYPNALYKGFTTIHDALVSLRSYANEVPMIRAQPARPLRPQMVGNRRTSIYNTLFRFLAVLASIVSIIWVVSFYFAFLVWLICDNGAGFIFILVLYIPLCINI